MTQRRACWAAMLAWCAVCAAPWASAQEVTVTVTGSVEQNQIRGDMSSVNPGDPVVMSFNVDSTDFVDSPNFPTRGYPLDLSSFSMSVGGVPVLIEDPQPFGPAYFVLRDNDPAVDGFLLSRNIDIPQPVSVTIPGLAPVHELNFIRTFNDGTPLPSLDILDALGTYDFSNLSVYGWDIGRFGNPGALYIYETITLNVVPEPATWSLLCVATILVGGWRRGCRARN